MNIGIIVYSETNHTLEVATLLKEQFEKNQHQVQIERIRASKNRVKLLETPSCEPYEVVIFCSPVQGFSLSNPMKNYLKKLTSLEGKQIGLLLTQYFKRASWGGNQAMRTMITLIEDRKGIAYAAGIVHWSAKDREEQIQRVVSSFLL